MTGCEHCDYLVMAHNWQTLMWHLVNIHRLVQQDASGIAGLLSRGYWVRYALDHDGRILGWTEAWHPPEIARRRP